MSANLRLGMGLFLEAVFLLRNGHTVALAHICAALNSQFLGGAELRLRYITRSNNTAKHVTKEYKEKIL